MRVRKGLLALRDFQKELSTEELMDVLKQVNASEAIHQKVKSQVANTIRMAEYMEDISQSYQSFVEQGRFFLRERLTHYSKGVPPMKRHLRMDH